MAVVVPTDLETILHIDIGNNNDPKVVALIARAQEAVEGVLGRPIESHQVIDTFRGHFRYLILTQWPVTAVASVVENSVTLTVTTEYQFDEVGVVYRYRNGDPRIWERTAGEIVVTYTAGFPITSVGYKRLAGIVLSIAGRMFEAAAAFASLPDGVGAVRQESIGSYSVTYASETDSGKVADTAYLTDEDYRAIEAWR